MNACLFILTQLPLFLTVEITGLAFIKLYLWELKTVRVATEHKKRSASLYFCSEILDEHQPLKSERLFVLSVPWMFDEALVTLCVIVSSVQRRGLVACALPDHWRERLHPQQLCGSIRLHPGRRVNPLFFFSFFLCPMFSAFSPSA